MRNLHGMKVTIIKPITIGRKLWSVGSTPSVTSELRRRLIASGHIAGDEPAEVEEAQPETKAEEEVEAPRPRPTRKPRKPKN